jgi:hypothetical protein
MKYLRRKQPVKLTHNYLMQYTKAKSFLAAPRAPDKQLRKLSRLELKPITHSKRDALAAHFPRSAKEEPSAITGGLEGELLTERPI